MWIACGAVPEIQSQSVGRERQTQGLTWTVETSKPTYSGILPPTRPYLLILLILSNNTILWWLSIYIYVPMGTILIETITVPKQLLLVRTDVIEILGRPSTSGVWMLLQPRKHALKTFMHRLLGIVKLQNEKTSEEEQCQGRQMVCLKLRGVSRKQRCKVCVVSGGPFCSDREKLTFSDLSVGCENWAWNLSSQLIRLFRHCQWSHEKQYINISDLGRLQAFSGVPTRRTNDETCLCCGWPSLMF